MLYIQKVQFLITNNSLNYTDAAEGDFVSLSIQRNGNNAVSDVLKLFCPHKDNNISYDGCEFFSI